MVALLGKERQIALSVDVGHILADARLKYQ